MEEIWVDIVGYEGIYEVSNLGNVRSVDRKIIMSNGGVKFQKGKMLKKSMDNLGYLKVNLYDDNRKRKTWRVHKLVAMHFIDNPNNYTYVNFKDRDYENVSADNLKWVSEKESNAKGSKISNKTRVGKEVVL